jgi:hypothetical protein
MTGENADAGIGTKLHEGDEWDGSDSGGGDDAFVGFVAPNPGWCRGPVPLASAPLP